MSTELQYQSKETERLVKINNRLTKENKAMRRQTELHEQSQMMLVRRAKKYQNSIKQLSDELTTRHKEGAMQKKVVYSSDPAKALLETKQTILMLEQQSSDLEEVVRAAQEQADMARLQLEDTRKATARMLGVQNESLSFTLMCMEFVKLKFAEAQLGTGPSIAGISAHRASTSVAAAAPAPRGSTSSGGGSFLPAISRSNSQSAGFENASERRSSMDRPASQTSMSSKSGAGPGGALSRRGSAGSEVVRKATPGDFKLEELVNVEHREAFLDLLLDRFKSFGPEQIALITHM
jgi:hypothetical protein